MTFWLFNNNQEWFLRKYISQLMAEQKWNFTATTKSIINGNGVPCPLTMCMLTLPVVGHNIYLRIPARTISQRNVCKHSSLFVCLCLWKRKKSICLKQSTQHRRPQTNTSQYQCQPDMWFYILILFLRCGICIRPQNCNSSVCVVSWLVWWYKLQPLQI